jgi:hypothetical protein
MSNRNKAIIALVLIVGWIGFWKWADTTLPDKTEVEVMQTRSPELVCFDLKNKKVALETRAKELADEADSLQKVLLKEKLQEILSQKVLSNKDSEILKEYLSYDLMKIVSEKSDNLGDVLLRQIDLKPEVVRIFNKLLSMGKLQPYLFEEVQTLGQELRTKYQEANSMAQQNPECFKANSEIEKQMEELIKDLKTDDSNNGWIAKQSAMELVNSLL